MIDRIAAGSILLTFLGLAILIAGYQQSDTRAGPLLIWLGVTTMIGVIVYYILQAVA